MKFYELIEDDEQTGQWRLGKVSDQKGKTVLLDSGSALRRKGPLNAVIAEKGEAHDYSITTYNVPVARVPLAAAVAAVAGSDLQRLPLNIAGYHGFEALNALRVVPCLDEDRSQIKPMTELELAEQRRLGLRDTFRLVGDYCIDGASVPEDAHFFRPKGLEGLLLVSESVKKAIMATGAIGPNFTLIGERKTRTQGRAEHGPAGEATRVPRLSVKAGRTTKRARK